MEIIENVRHSSRVGRIENMRFVKQKMEILKSLHASVILGDSNWKPRENFNLVSSKSALMILNYHVHCYLKMCV